MRLVVAAMLHETNTFSPIPTDVARFGGAHSAPEASGRECDCERPARPGQHRGDQREGPGFQRPVGMPVLVLLEGIQALALIDLLGLVAEEHAIAVEGTTRREEW